MPAGNNQKSSTGLVLRLGIIVLLAVAGVVTTGFLAAHRPNPPADPPTTPAAATAQPAKAENPGDAKPFQSWPADRKPKFVVVLTGQQHNYIKPCGCSRPLFGGLERRYNMFEELRTVRGWPTIALDLGDIYYRQGNDLAEQAEMKYKLSMDALELMRYSAAGIGPEEFRSEIVINALLADRFANPQKMPALLSLNLQNKNGRYPNEKNGSIVQDGRLIQVGNSKVGVTAVLGPKAVANTRCNDKFDDYAKELPATINALAAHQPSLMVLLFHGDEEEALACAKRFPQFDVILYATIESDAPGIPKVVTTDRGQTWVIGVGHKGRHAGVVGVFDQNGKNELHYERFVLGEELETPRDKEAAHPIVKLYDEYAKEVQKKNFLQRVIQQPHTAQVTLAKIGQALGIKEPASFVGSEKCKACHEADYEIWMESKHSVAMEALEQKATKPSLRQYDPECVVCHSIGFGYQTGYVDEKKTPHLKHVGCENCHGPGSYHVAHPNNKDLLPALSPWKANPKDSITDENVEKRIDINLCAKCHDTDNDPNFKIKKYWPKVAHGPTVKKKKPAN